MELGDSRLKQIEPLDRKLKQNAGRSLFLDWAIEFEYSKQELESAELFHLMITSCFEPAGEECGTIYDESRACQHVFTQEKDLRHIYRGLTLAADVCGAGRLQISDLILDLRKAPKTKDISQTIANEWIVSQRLAELLVDAKLTGFELRPVHHKARSYSDSIEWSSVPRGRELLRQAKQAGLLEQSWPFYVWLNRPEQSQLVEKARMEYAQLRESRPHQRSKSISMWYQLMVNSKPLRAIAPTRFGERPFDSENRYCCPNGHVAGLNLLSELHLNRSDWDGSDICCTKQLVGVRRGMLVPAPLLVISPRTRKLLANQRIKGWHANITYFG